MPDTFRHAFYPLTLPLAVGPGSISVAITLGANAAHRHALHPLTILTALIGTVLQALAADFPHFIPDLSKTFGANVLFTSLG